MSVRVLISDDHALVREGLASLLREAADIEVVGQAANGEEALQAIRTLRPTVALADVAMPGMTGIELIRTLRDANIPTAVVIVSMYGEGSLIRSALEAGAAGYILKDAVQSQLVAAVRAAAVGDVYLCPRAARSALAGLGPGDWPSPLPLTPREREVLRLVALGKSNKEIGVALDISTRTAEGHRASIMDKLGIRTVAGLVKYALKHHLVSLEEDP